MCPTKALRYFIHLFQLPKWKVILKKLTDSFKISSNLSRRKAQHVHNRTARVSVPSKIKSLSFLPPYFKIKYNTIFPSKPNSTKWSLSFRFSEQNSSSFPQVSSSFIYLFLFHDTNNTQTEIQVIMPLNMKFFPSSFCWLSLRSKHSSHAHCSVRCFSGKIYLF